jgi:hypothetical protein
MAIATAVMATVAAMSSGDLTGEVGDMLER